MNRIAKTTWRRGIALVATLALIIFLSAMIAEVIRGNVAQRRYLRVRRSETVALCLAESGVAEALRAIARQSGENKIETADSGGRKFRVEWREERPGAHTYEIRSVGINDSEDLASARRTVKVRAQVPVGQPARILFWTAAAE
jgi:Tfp pilus assembly protein PilX